MDVHAPDVDLFAVGLLPEQLWGAVSQATTPRVKVGLGIRELVAEAKVLQGVRVREDVE